MNKKGFILAEAIVVSVFIIGMIAYIAINMLPLVSKYEKVINYDDLQEIYLVNDLYDEIKVRDLNVEPSGDGIVYNYSMNESAVNCTPLNNPLCDNNSKIKEYIYKYLFISEIVIGHVDKTNLSRSMREYYNYYKTNNPEHVKADDGKLNKNVMLVKFQDNTFASIVMR